MKGEAYTLFSCRCLLFSRIIQRIGCQLEKNISPAGQSRSISVFKKNLNASKPSEHPPSGEKMSKGLGGNIGSRDKTSSWYQTGSPM